MAENTVLVIDDNWYNRDIFRMALESADYLITEAEDGEAGLEILKEKTFDLLILDLQMPKIDGIQVLKSLRQDERHKTMRVLVVTANPHMATDDVNKLADHIMMKPVDIVSFARFTQRLKTSFKSDKSSAEEAQTPAAATPAPKPTPEPAPTSAQSEKAPEPEKKERLMRTDDGE